MHDVDGQVVEHAAVDQEVAFGQDRGEDAGDSHAGAHCLPQRAPAVHHGDGVGEVAGDAEAGHPEVLDLRIAVDALQHLRDLTRGKERDHGHGGVEELQGRGQLPRQLHGVLVVQAHGEGGAEDGAHAGAAHQVHGDPALRQGFEDPDMREAAGPAATQHQPHAAAGDPAHEAVKICRPAQPDVMVAGSRVTVQPGRRA